MLIEVLTTLTTNIFDQGDRIVESSSPFLPICIPSINQQLSLLLLHELDRDINVTAATRMVIQFPGRRLNVEPNKWYCKPFTASIDPIISPKLPLLQLYSLPACMNWDFFFSKNMRSEYIALAALHAVQVVCKTYD